MGAFKLSKEAKARLTIRQQYDAHEVVKNLFRWKGTALAFVIPRLKFWLHFGLYVLMFVGYRVLPEEQRGYYFDNWKLTLGDLTPMTSLVMFALVFYNGQCYNTYRHLYELGNQVSGSIHELSLHFKAFFHDPETRWDLIRHVLAAQHVFYYNIKREECENRGIKIGSNKHPGTWEEFSENVLIKKQLLKKKETDLLNTYKYDRVKVLLSWAETTFFNVSKTHEYYNKTFMDEHAVMAATVMRELNDVRANMSSTKHGMLLNVPFSYYHFVNLLATVYLLFLGLAYLGANEGNGSYNSILGFACICILVFGLQAVADSMADPFGDDPCDFNTDALQVCLYEEIVGISNFEDAEMMMELGQAGKAPHLPWISREKSSGDDTFAGKKGEVLSFNGNHLRPGAVKIDMVTSSSSSDAAVVHREMPELEKTLSDPQLSGANEPITEQPSRAESFLTSRQPSAPHPPPLGIVYPKDARLAPVQDEEAFHIGIEVSGHSPFVVKKVDDLCDTAGHKQGEQNYGNEPVEVGDVLFSVDSINVEHVPISRLRELLRGTRNSVVKVTLRRKSSYHMYEIRVIRHHFHEFDGVEHRQSIDHFIGAPQLRKISVVEQPFPPSQSLSVTQQMENGYSAPFRPQTLEAPRHKEALSSAIQHPSQPANQSAPSRNLIHASSPASSEPYQSKAPGLPPRRAASNLSASQQQLPYLEHPHHFVPE